MDILKWIENWYQNSCDGDWEHGNGITIRTLDNPGWDLKIDLNGTELEGIEQEWRLIENHEQDWYGVKIEDGNYKASGDPNKLEFLLNLFKQLVEEHITDANCL